MEHLQEYKKFVSLLPGIRPDKEFHLTDDMDIVDGNMLYTLPKGSKVKIIKIDNKIVYFLSNGKLLHTHQIKLQNYI